MIEKIDNKTLTAFSVSVAEKTDADKAIIEYNNNKAFATKNKQEINLDSINNIYSNMAQKTLIKDIADPVLFTVTLTALPCVNKAMFCENILKETDEVDIMVSDKTAEDSFFENIKASVKSLRESRNKDKQSKSENIDVDKKIENANKSLKADMDKQIGGIRESIKSEFDQLRTEVAEELNAIGETEPVTPEPETINKPTEPETTTNAEQPTESEPEPKEPKEHTTEEETPKQEKAEENKEPANKSMKGKGGKAKMDKERVNTSEQLKNPNDSIIADKSYNTSPINEREYLYRFIKGNKQANKSLDSTKISYKGLSIIPEAIPTAPAFSLIAPALKADFDDTFTEAETNKLIFDTQTYGLYIRELLDVDPLMTDANFRIDYEVSEEERVMYALRYDQDPTEDGAHEDNYYFDRPVDSAVIEVSKQKLHPEPVRAKLHISDRQIKQNVFGESLVDKAMSLVQGQYNEGIARINYFSDTAFESDDTINIKFARRDGLLKQAGVTLGSNGTAEGGATGDFDLDDGINKVFRKMFRSLPYEAQKDGLFSLYVPPYVYDAYREYYIKSDGVNFLGNITDEIPLKYGKIQVKEAPILADPAGLELHDDKVPMLLASPQNTHFIASRALRIEPERVASTSSTKYWYSGDFDVKFALPEYSVVANISKEEYEDL